MPRGSWLFSQILFDVIIQDWRNLIVDFLHLLRNYIYCLHDGAEFSKTYPSFFVDKASCTRQFESKLSLHSLASLFPIKKGFFLPLRLSCKESSTSNQAFSIVFTTPSVPLVGDRNLRRKDVTALLGARNRYAIRLADQSGLRQIVRDGTAWE